MIFVRAGLSDGVDDGARVAPVLRAEIIGEDAELFQGVGIGHDGCRVGEGIVIVAAIEHVIVLIAARAVDRDGGLLRQVDGAGAGYDAGNQELQLEGIAAVQRKLVDTLHVDDLLERAAHGFDEAYGAADGNGIAGLAEFENDVRRAGLVGIEVNGFGDELAETCVRGLQAVIADGEAGEAEAAVGIGSDLPLPVGRRTHDFDDGARHDARRWNRRQCRDGTGRLGEEQRRQREQDYTDHIFHGGSKSSWFLPSYRNLAWAG